MLYCNYENGSIKCDTTWRVSNASCWIEWDILLITDGDVILDPAGESVTFTGDGEIFEKLIEPCPSSCCVRRFKVCRETWPGYTPVVVHITDLGLTDIGTSCTATYRYAPLDPNDPPEYVECEYKCDALENIDEPFGDFNNKIAIKEDKDFEEKTLIQFKNYYSNKKLFIRLKNSQLDNLKVKITDLNGKIVYSESYQIDKNNEMQFQINLDYLDTGTYIYIIEADNHIINNDKFQIVK